MSCVCLLSGVWVWVWVSRLNFQTTGLIFFKLLRQAGGSPCLVPLILSSRWRCRNAEKRRKVGQGLLPSPDCFCPPHPPSAGKEHSCECTQGDVAHLQEHQTGEEDGSRQSEKAPEEISPSHSSVGSFYPPLPTTTTTTTTAVSPGTDIHRPFLALLFDVAKCCP